MTCTFSWKSNGRITNNYTYLKYTMATASFPANWEQKVMHEHIR